MSGEPVPQPRPSPPTEACGDKVSINQWISRQGRHLDAPIGLGRSALPKAFVQKSCAVQSLTTCGGFQMAFEGGCYCGKIRYVAQGEPRLKAQCHCRECQYISGGGPNMCHRKGSATLAVRQKPSRAAIWNNR